MKLLSIAIPCYNSQDYMEHCIESLLTGGEEVEILVVDDGSKDQTAQIADSYAEICFYFFPAVFKTYICIRWNQNLFIFFLHNSHIMNIPKSHLIYKLIS